MKKILLPLFVLALTGTISNAQNFNLTFRSQVNYNNACASIWGYVDSNGNEYALVGTQSGVSIVDINDPDNPDVLFNVSHTNSLWREIKTYGTYAYATNEDGGGLLIINLANLPASYQQYTFSYTDGNGDTQNDGHTLWIDEQGRLFIFGGSYPDGDGGYTCFDLTVDPINPPYLGQRQGAGEVDYIHDGFVRGDTLWASEIYDGELTIVNVSDPANPQVLGSVTTPNQFTHNSWPTSDNQFTFTTDEVNDSYVTAYDVSDLGNITEVDRFQSNAGSGSVAHNVHLLNDQFMLVAYYRDGVVVVDVSHPDNMIQVGAYDTYNGGGGGYDGTWGVYPYFPSGTIIASQLEQWGVINGNMVILTPTYVSAAFLEGIVTDTFTSSPLSGVYVDILSDVNEDYTDLTGAYATGAAGTGTYTVQFQKAGYLTKTIQLSLVGGVTTTLDVELVSLAQFDYTGTVLDSATLAPIANAEVLLDGGLNGTFTATTDANGDFTVFDLFTGYYDVYAGRWGHRTKGLFNTSINQVSAPIQILLAKGYYDDFIFDFDWAITGPASGAEGRWERGEPIGTTGGGGVQSNPDFDIAGDLGNQCYVTGNGGGQTGTDDLDEPYTYLTTPPMNLITYGTPWISFYAWWQDLENTFGGGPPDDEYEISISNGNITVPLLTLDANDADEQWDWYSFKVINFLPITNNMTVTFAAHDYQDAGNDNWIEAGLDYFVVTDSLNTGISSSAIENMLIESFPNPFAIENMIRYDFRSIDMLSTTIDILNSIGQQVASYPVTDSFGILSWGTEFNNGFYFARINNAQRVLKIIPVIKSN